MTIAISYETYCDLMSGSWQAAQQLQSKSAFEVFFDYPTALGMGTCQWIGFEGMDLDIQEFSSPDRVLMTLPDWGDHPLEYSFTLTGHSSGSHKILSPGSYVFCGSGLYQQDCCDFAAEERHLSVSLHLQPEVLRTMIGDQSGELPADFQHLIREASQPYHEQQGTTTPAMQLVLRQVLLCPYDAAVRRVYLQSKALELMALVLEQDAEAQTGRRSLLPLKSDHIDRIHRAREILLQNLNQPLSLLELAKQVGLNDCSLKSGFKQVFGKTVFSYLHDYRMEQARFLLLSGEMKINEVRQAIGFADARYFAAAFRKKYGTSPRNYRAAQLKKSV